VRGAAAKREAVAHLRTAFGMSERRACTVVGGPQEHALPFVQAGRRGPAHPFARAGGRFGYGRLHILVRREGRAVNRKKVQRRHREEDFTVRRRRGRKRSTSARAPAPVLALPNQRWSLDVAYGQLATGRLFCVLNVVDDITRECLAALVDTSISGRRVVRELAVMVAERVLRPLSSATTGQS
jgi:putative transposase